MRKYINAKHGIDCLVYSKRLINISLLLLINMISNNDPFPFTQPFKSKREREKGDINEPGEG